MLKIDIISGFLGAGKTTFIKRILKTKLSQEKVVLIENEFGEISIDSSILSSTGVNIKELSQGCICCSLVGDFSKSLKEVINNFNPDRIIIEPSGVGKLSDVKKAVVDADLGEYLNSFICLVDAVRAKTYLRNFGEFFKDQIASASTVVLSRTDIANADVVEQALKIVRQLNTEADVITTPIDSLSDEDLFKAYEGIKESMLEELLKEHRHEHGEECDDPDCECHHHHHHLDGEDEECECHHHHHEHGEECDDPECECHHHHDHDEHEHHHHHHHGHDADEVFNSVGIETAKVYDMNQFVETLKKLSTSMDFGIIVRAKGIVLTNQGWKEFNLSMNEVNVTDSHPIKTGQIVVIGSNIDELEIKELF